VMTAMRAMKSDIEKEISRLGSQTFMVRKWPGIYFGGPDGFEKYWRRKNITLSQAQLVESKATLALSVGVETVFWGGQIESRYKKTAPTVQLFGETSGSFPARNWLLGEGRLLLDMDVDGARDVCVLGATLAKSIFPLGSAIGERLKINGFNYTVVGVLAPKGGSLGGDQDNFAVVPITAGLNHFGVSQWARSLNILVQARDQASYDDTVEQVRGIMRVLRKVPPGKEDDFEIFSNDSLIAQFNSFTMAVRLGVSLISSIALLAAGIGIMNIMLVSVTERTKEIGIRKSLGARQMDILKQFLVEAVTLAFFGGSIGVLIAWIIGRIMTAFFLPTNLSLVAVMITIFVSGGIGICAGVFPAWKAARLDPIEALRAD